MGGHVGSVGASILGMGGGESTLTIKVTIQHHHHHQPTTGRSKKIRV